MNSSSLHILLLTTTISTVISFAVSLTSCRNDELVVPTTEQVIPSDSLTTADSYMQGLYILCEGNMGANKATVDYLDLTATDGQLHYYKNIYPQRNPNTVMELGDVGNDIQIYGSRAWIVVNASNKVEVCTADSLHRIGQINIANGRYVVFYGPHAYVSSYAGPIQMGNRQQGWVYKVDTLTLEKVDSITVGRQPEEMAIVGHHLYVANSGGYTPPDYDSTVSVIRLDTFSLERTITIAPNLHRLRSDRYGQLWLTSRGNYDDIDGRLYCLTTTSGNAQIHSSFDIPVSEMCIVGDSLYYIASQYNNATNTSATSFGLIDVARRTPLTTTLFSSEEVADMQTPYGIIVHPTHHDIYLMDATNYVSSGQLLHIDADGRFLWRQSTGDIPSRAAFIRRTASGQDDNPTGDSTSGQGESQTDSPAGGTSSSDSGSPWIAAVDEYVPAPGQFINTLPTYSPGDDATTMAARCTEAIAGQTQGLVSLGGFGGYITFHFDHPVDNIHGEADIMILGNSISGSSEPGIVMVSQDTNANGLPDDEWYELMGSADIDNSDSITYGYSVTYTYTPMADVPWTDSQGQQGVISRNTFHEQEYFPLWLAAANDGHLTLSGTLLPSNATQSGSLWTLSAYSWGYVDNLPNSDTDANSFNIDHAVDPITRRSVSLTHIDFVRVYSAMNQQAGWLGETSTEISGARDLHR